MIDFVGAGPGAVDLITVRGKNLIEKADVIIYAGSLVNFELLNFAKKGCQIYNSAEMTLEEITSVMVSAEMDGKNTVRLHTGDPSIYGAIKEQMNILDKYNLEYKVCPGVSSLFGAAASLKTEYTIPDVSQSVIITRMEGKTPVPEKEDISLLASHNATMVVFLSAGMLNELSRKLIRGGYKSDTPAAIVYKATWNDEKVIKTTVSEIAKSAEKNNINKTALIIIGDFLGNNYKRSLLYNPSFSHEFRKGD
ncbi:MAG: precorrin-4 C(11)-methyltransferase [Clostridiales bacterium]|nr:precorrin-4 C(11)-methyltransferase [Clostridiales bacterium]